MRSMTFLVNDQSTGQIYPDVWITITENDDGTLSFGLSQEGVIIGDLRGIFFDIADESLIGSLQVLSPSIPPTQVLQGDDSVVNLSNGTNMQGLEGSDGGYDMGIQIGSPGIGADDIRDYSFVLASPLRSLTLEDFANIDFGVRLTSVGPIDNREFSSKILETTSPPIHAMDDAATVYENDSVTGNILTNDMAGLPITDQVSLIQWSGGALGSTILLANAEGATLTVNTNGSYVLDASIADRLSEGEVLQYSFTYDVKSENEPTSYSQDSATFIVTVIGVNDGPIARDDHAGQIFENQTAQGNSLVNDSDIDRLDTFSVYALQGVLDGGVGDLDGAAGSIKVLLGSGALVTMDANGNYLYDPNGAFNSLNTGQSANDLFQYTIVDNHGATSTATVDVVIQGIGNPPPGPFDFPTMHQALSNIVLYLDDGDSLTPLYKIKFTPDASLGNVYDADALNLPSWIAAHPDIIGANTDLVAFSIHAGIEYALTTYVDGKKIIKPLGPGEGQLYIHGDGSYLPGEADYKPTASNHAPTAQMLAVGLTETVIGAHVNHATYIL